MMRRRRIAWPAVCLGEASTLVQCLSVPVQEHLQDKLAAESHILMRTCLCNVTHALCFDSYIGISRVKQSSKCEALVSQWSNKTYQEFVAYLESGS
jgi:hypothetical protein